MHGRSVELGFLLEPGLGLFATMLLHYALIIFILRRHDR